MIHSTSANQLPVDKQERRRPTKCSSPSSTFLTSKKSITPPIKQKCSDGNVCTSCQHGSASSRLTAVSCVSELPDQMSRVLRRYQTRQWTSCCKWRERRLPRKHSFPFSRLILHPRRGERWANEYRRGNVSLQSAPSHFAFIHTHTHCLDRFMDGSALAHKYCPVHWHNS